MLKNSQRFLFIIGGAIAFVGLLLAAWSLDIHRPNLIQERNLEIGK